MASEWISSASVTSVTGSDVISFPEVLLLVLPGKLFSNWDHTSGRTEELGNLSTRFCGLRSQLPSQNGLRGLYSGTDTFLTHREVAVLQLNPGTGQASRVTLYEDVYALCAFYKSRQEIEYKRWHFFFPLRNIILQSAIIH